MAKRKPDLLETPIGTFSAQLEPIGCCDLCQVCRVRQLSGRRPTPVQWRKMAKVWYQRLHRDGREVRLVEFVET